MRLPPGVTATSLPGVDLVFWPQAALDPLEWTEWTEPVSGEAGQAACSQGLAQFQRKRQDYGGQVRATKCTAQLSDSPGKWEWEEGVMEIELLPPGWKHQEWEMSFCFLNPGRGVKLIFTEGHNQPCSCLQRTKCNFKTV